MRGFVSGLVWGGVVSVLGIGLLSQMMPLPGTAPADRLAVANDSAAPSPVSALPEPEPVAEPEPKPEPQPGPAQEIPAPEPVADPEPVVSEVPEIAGDASPAPDIQAGTADPQQPVPGDATEDAAEDEPVQGPEPSEPPQGGPGGAEDLAEVAPEKEPEVVPPVEAPLPRPTEDAVAETMQPEAPAPQQEAPQIAEETGPADVPLSTGAPAAGAPDSAPIAESVTNPATSTPAEPVAAAAATALAVLLLDDGASEPDRQALTRLGVPVTIVLDPARPDLVGAAAAWRLAGYEVALLSGAELPDKLSRIVAVIDLPRSGGAQGSVQVPPVEALRALGLGYVGDQAADLREGGIAAAELLRQIDNAGESRQIIRRYLDRAALRAQRDGEAVVFGHLRLATISALRDWMADNSASRLVALKPLSVVLQGPQSQPGAAD